MTLLIGLCAVIIGTLFLERRLPRGRLLKARRQAFVGTGILAVALGLSFAETASLGSEFGGPPGFSKGDGGEQCHDPASLPFVQCVFIAKPQYATGTFTVKDSSEVFMVLKCAGSNGDAVVWAGEHFQGTVSFTTPRFPNDITGPCWVYWEMLNNTGQAQSRGAIFEYQITMYGE